MLDNEKLEEELIPEDLEQTGEDQPVEPVQKAEPSVALDDDELDRQAQDWLKSRGKLQVVAEQPAEKAKAPEPWEEGYSEYVTQAAVEAISKKSQIVDQMVTEMKQYEPDLPDAELAAIRAQLLRPEYKVNGLESMLGSKTHLTIADSAYRRLEKAGKIEAVATPESKRTPVTPRGEPTSTLDSATKRSLEAMNSKVLNPAYRLTEDDLKGVL